MFLYLAVHFWLVMVVVTMWLDNVALRTLLNNKGGKGIIPYKIPFCRSDSNPISTLLPEYSSSSMSDSIATEEEAAIWGKKITTLQLSDDEDVRSEAEENAKSSPAASWGPSSPATKLPTPVGPAIIYCEAGSHGQVYTAGFINLLKVLASLCMKVNVAALPAGTVWGDVLGFAITKVEAPSGNICYKLYPVEHYWVEDCHPGLSTHQDIANAIKEAQHSW